MPQIPSYLRPRGPAPPDAFDDPLTHAGEVVEVIYPEDEKSWSKKFMEYRVLAQYRDRHSNTGLSREYRCTLANPLHGFPDRGRQVLRAGTPNREGLGKGSKVVVQCLSGEHNLGVITTGLRDQDDDRGLRDSKVVYDMEVNGVLLQVRTDGSVRMLRLGPKDADGKVTDSPKVLGSVSVEKDGSVLLGTQPDADGDPSQYVRIDAGSGTVKIQADEGVRTGSASDKTILGSTYRRGESQMNSELSSGLTQAEVACSIAASAASSLSGMITSPSTAAAMFTTLSTQLSTMAQALGRMEAAVQAFEARAEEFLSKKNLSD